MRSVDMFKFRKLALEPILGPADGEFFKKIHFLSVIEKERLVECILRNSLGALWHKLLKKNNACIIFSEDHIKLLEKSAMSVVAKYLMQKFILEVVVRKMEDEQIPYALFKGAHLREILYKEPAVRFAEDIDILIHPENLEKVVKTLVREGFRLEVKQQNISHEITLYLKNVAIDLHWHILRPGRLRMSLTEEFLAKRSDYISHIGFDTETTLFIMLVHPVFTKYSTTSLASLIRFVDLYRWVEQRPIDWNYVLQLLRKYGVCTAAWITAVYYQDITGKALPSSFLQNIRPSLLKQLYFKSWIRTDLSSKFLSKPFLIQIGFTLPAHDTFFDALRFINRLLLEKKQSQLKTERLLLEIGSSLK